MDNIGKVSVLNLKNNLEELAQFNTTPGEGITRVLFTEEEIKARNFIKAKMKEVGLAIREDAVGNIFGKLEGENPDLPPVWTGSHIDTVLNAGCFDGTVGVIGGLEALRLIKESNLPRSRNLELVVFTSEEPTRFGKGCLGSRTMAGKLTLEEARNLYDEEGYSFAELLEKLGYDLNLFEAVKVPKDAVRAFVELHIEQGAILENLGIPIGVVTTISAPTNINLNVIGKQGHAGSTPMDMRKDALTAAAEIILKLESLAKASLSPNTVGTVGKINVFPNASNVIPGEVFLTIDIRDSDFAVKDRLMRELFSDIAEIGKNRKVEINTKLLNHDYPKYASPQIVETIKNVCGELQIPCREMVSGAYHDAMFVAEFAPFGMIFVPSKDGISHNPEEWTDYEDIAKGVDVLARTIFKLANS